MCSSDLARPSAQQMADNRLKQAEEYAKQLRGGKSAQDIAKEIAEERERLRQSSMDDREKYDDINQKLSELYAKKQLLESVGGFGSKPGDVIREATILALEKEKAELLARRAEVGSRVTEQTRRESEFVQRGVDAEQRRIDALGERLSKLQIYN